MQRSSSPERVGARSTPTQTPVPSGAATADPDQGKTMLAARCTQHAAGLGFLRDQSERGEDAQAARVPRELIDEYVEALGRAVRIGAADDAWRLAFDTAGWQTDMLILLCPPHEAMPAAFPRSADG